MHRFFPIGEQAHWLNSLTVKPEILQWLFDPMSLTAKLKTISSQFKLQVLGEAWVNPEDCNSLNFNEPTLIREVLLFCQNKPWVYAHTQVPRSTIEAGNQSLQNLGEQPLGEYIFKLPGLERCDIEVAEFTAQSKVFELAKTLFNGELPNILYGRRSVFKLQQFPFTVTEVFLADCQFYYE
ncbi:chorismate lyase [Catenovulum sp. 2E275]|uniref:chorismate--pyruvate lyase family protein n=1 Tax=Catenovulum sp. 2E275 TaxID=2980497 RepID=UPI0021CFF027|nr:chorismate lyase [Catenovulum sp. 2E275]MCU4674356.1 chorismate lyase [Catenovulum sp. 2E275]